MLVLALICIGLAVLFHQHARLPGGRTVSGIVTPFLIVVGAWIDCRSPVLHRVGCRPAPVTGIDLHDPLSMQRQRRETGATTKGQTRQRFPAINRRCHPTNYRNTKGDLVTTQTLDLDNLHLLTRKPLPQRRANVCASWRPSRFLAGEGVV